MLRLAMALLLVAALAPAAFARPPASSRPDPQSPAGVEYQLPLERARTDAGAPPAPRDDPAADTSTGQRSSKAEALFGAGIERRHGRGAGERRLRPDGRKAGDQGTDGRRRRLTAAVAGSDGSSGLVAPILAALVIALGTAFGLGLRRILRTR